MYFNFVLLDQLHASNNLTRRGALPILGLQKNMITILQISLGPGFSKNMITILHVGIGKKLIIWIRTRPR